MSAYMVTKETIDSMVGAALALTDRNDSWVIEGHWRNITTRDATKIGRMLWDENARNVRARYGDADESGMVVQSELDGYAYDFMYGLEARLVGSHGDTEKVWAIANVFSIISGYEYQCSETEDWPASEAFKFIEGIRYRLARALPGYGDMRDVDGRQAFNRGKKAFVS